MFGKKTDTPQIEAAIAKSANFEVTIADMARRSERRAWLVAWASIMMSLILAGGYFYFLPLKEKVPYLVMADAYTGTSTIARLTGDFGDQSIKPSEALNRSNISHFILARESYDKSQIGKRDWATVHAMATSNVTGSYAAMFEANNPNNPAKIFGDGKTIRVNILSVQLQGPQDTGPKVKTATVRFQRSIYNKANGAVEPMDSKIAMLEYVYKSNLKMDERNRILNPLGFQVTGYRVDNDYAASPPVQSEYPQLPAPTVPGASLPSVAPATNVVPSPSNPAGTSMGPTTIPAATDATPASANNSNANGVSP